MADIGDMPSEYLKKNKEFEINDLNFKISEVDTRILNFKNQIIRAEFEKQMHLDGIKKVQDEISLIEQQTK